MDFQKLLLNVGHQLRSEEVRALAFLCGDLLGRCPSTMDASVLFSELASRDHLTPESPGLLTELLLIIRRNGLVRRFNLSDQAPITCILISHYRKLLYKLSEDLTDDQLKQMKFLLYSDLPRRKLDEAVTTLDVFLLMEHMDLLSDTNLTLLESIIETISPVSRDKIRRFKETQEHSIGPYAQDTGRPRAMTYPSVEPQQLIRPLHPDNSASCGTVQVNFSLTTLRPLAQPEPSMNSSCMSVDANAVNGREDLSHDLRRLNTGLGRERVQPLTDSEKLGETKEEGLATYPMTSEKRGICLIINNEFFSDAALKLRKGTKFDEDRLKKVFTWLGFEVLIEQNCNQEKMLTVVEDLSKREDLRHVDCLVCCVLSHGQKGSVHAVDGDLVTFQQLMEPFSGARCRALVGKPKLFFIQACQGIDEQAAVHLEADSPAGSSLSSDSRKFETIPSDADFLLGVATVPSYVSFRDKRTGSWFIKSLCQNLIEMVPKRSNLVTILTKVNADVSKMTDIHHEKKQMPQPAFSLTKNVIFPIPEAPPPTLTS